MIFQHTCQKVLTGEKTQTRRLFQPGDYGWLCGYVSNSKRGFLYSSVSSQNQEKITPRWQVGKTYAVQPGRGQKSVGRIEITNIRREDVREISAIDTRAEGFRTIGDFLSVWTHMHDRPANYEFCALYDDNQDAAIESLLNRPKERYTAWVIEFKLVQE